MRIILGPWPIRPALAAILYGFINQYAFVQSAEFQKLPILQVALNSLPATLAQSIALFGALFIAQVFQQRFDPDLQRISIYFLCIFAADCLFALARFIIVPQQIQEAGLIAGRDFLALLIVIGLFGVASDRLARQVRKTQEAAQTITRQREQLLVADEKARRQVAQYLHDSVQADLVVLALQLRGQALNLSRENAKRLTSVIDELDNLRLFDIRAASRRLNPDIDSMGLSAALRELANGYAPSMSIEISCPYVIPGASPDQLLGIYRIVEQAILNAATHGPAQTTEVHILESSLSGVSVKISNDGSALTPGYSPGTGVAIIEAWVNRFDGNWSLEQVDDQTVLTAMLFWKS